MLLQDNLEGIQHLAIFVTYLEKVARVLRAGRFQGEIG